MWPWDLHPLRLLGTPAQTCVPGAGGAVPIPPTQEWCACVRSCACAHVPPSDLLLLPGPVRLRAASQILSDFLLLPGRRASPGLLVSAGGPFPLRPPRSIPPHPTNLLRRSGLCLGSLTWLQDFFSAGGSNGDPQVISRERVSEKGPPRGSDRSGEGAGGGERRLRAGCLAGDPNSGPAARTLKAER